MEVYKRFKRDLAIFCVIYLIIIWFTGGFEYDSTDNGKERSGLALRVDALTGCHYLEGPGGGLTPRLDVLGKHMCWEE